MKQRRVKKTADRPTLIPLPRDLTARMANEEFNIGLRPLGTEPSRPTLRRWAKGNPHG